MIVLTGRVTSAALSPCRSACVSASPAPVRSSLAPPGVSPAPRFSPPSPQANSGGSVETGLTSGEAQSADDRGHV